MSHFCDTPKAYSARGKRAARKQTAVMRIEGQPVTYDDIAARLGITNEQAQYRMGRERKKPGAITWDRLRG